MTTKQINFLNMIAPIAVSQAAKHGNAIFPSVCIAQAIHESGWGSSKKMVNANALFGVKVGRSAWKFGTAWKGAAYKTGTTEYYDGKTATKIMDYFRAYDSVEDSTEDYFDMLCHCQRYKAALNRKTPRECITAIVAGGYATGPAYVTAIMKIIDSNSLTMFDTQNPTTVQPIFSWLVGKTYTTQNDLYIRKTPNGDKLVWDDLSADAKKHSRLDDEEHVILKRQTRVTVKEIKTLDNNNVWLRIPSGWICGRNSKNIYVM